MAKQGEGDARWIVADRSDGTNGAAARLIPPKKPPPLPCPVSPLDRPCRRYALGGPVRVWKG